MCERERECVREKEREREFIECVHDFAYSFERSERVACVRLSFQCFE